MVQDFLSFFQLKLRDLGKFSALPPPPKRGGKQYTRTVKNHVVVYYFNAEKWAEEAQRILQGLLI